MKSSPTSSLARLLGVAGMFCPRWTDGGGLPNVSEGPGDIGGKAD